MVGRISAPLLVSLLAVLAGLVLLAPAAFAFTADVSGPVTASIDDDALASETNHSDLAERVAGASGDVPLDQVHATADQVHGTVSGLGLPDDADPAGVTGVIGDKSAGQVKTQDSGPVAAWVPDAKTTAAAAGATGLLGLLFWAQNAAGLGLSRVLGAPLFSRIQKDDMLDNEGRELLYSLVQADPGISLSELSERSGLGWGTTVYHLGKLEDAGFLTSMRRGQMRHFFKAGHPAATQKDAIAVLKNRTAGNVARYLASTPGATQATIAKALGIKAPTVTKYVKRLEGEGLVHVEPAGRSKIVSATPGLADALLHIDAPEPPATVTAEPTLRNQVEAAVA